MRKEWPLVAFTILGQTAVGFFLLACLPLSWSVALGQYRRDPGFVLICLGFDFAFLAVAAGLSFFHLRHPIRALRVLANLGSSWLSREILFLLAFMGLVGLAFILVLAENVNGRFLKIVVSGAALSGVLFLTSMSKLYMLESIMEWDSAQVPFSFIATTLNLGTLLAAFVLCAGPGPGTTSSALLMMSASIIFIEILLAAALPRDQRIMRLRNGPSLRPPAEISRRLRLGGLACLTVGLIFIYLALAIERYQQNGDFLTEPLTRLPSPLLPLAIGLVFALAGEIAGRFQFYGLVRRPGD
jgi:anaerobic dimethyl sulfoxide reductase subunit C